MQNKDYQEENQKYFDELWESAKKDKWSFREIAEKANTIVGMEYFQK